ncbi:MAG: lamin tail domain-containing protein [Kiritimatiellae bacterium]|nr:lamin tail domain-containing protein [Kiritimatiellia bacterium]
MTTDTLLVARRAPLASLAGLLLLVLPCLSRAEILVPRGASWSYLKGTTEASDPRSDWRTIDFADSGWARGRAPFGYGNAPYGTTLSDMQNSYSSVFIRRTFTVSSLDPDDRLRLSVDYDDGFIVWVNGDRLSDACEPDGLPLHDSLASESHESGTFETTDLGDASDFLQVGENVIAVQVVNFGKDSSDCKIDVELATYRRVADTTFSADRGFYDSPFTVTIATATAGATIRYTTDGSQPTESTGTVGGTDAAAVSIGTTTCLRAAAFRGGYESTDVDTQTYIFLDDVIAQPHRPAGYPSKWQCTDASLPSAQRIITADYQMDPDVVNPSPSAMKEALRDIPTLSLTLTRGEMFGSAGSIYHNFEGDKTGSERHASLELIYPDGREGFQLDCAVRPHSHARWKRSFKLLFRQEFGPAKLSYDIFKDAPQNADSATDRFDKLILRAGNNDSWHAWHDGTNLTTYTRDQLVRDSQIAVNGFGCHGDYMHLYLNGLYWGLYNVVERTDEAWTSEYFGGEKEDWFAINHGGDITETAGSDARWDSMLSLATTRNMVNAGDYALLGQYLDVPAFADYIGLLSFCGTGDWPANNWYAGNRNEPSGPALFFVWDAEDSFILKDGRSSDGAWLHPNLDTVTNAWGLVPLAALWTALTNSAEFRLAFADSVYANGFNGGPLAEANVHARFQTINARIEKAITAESARWGDGERWPPGAPDGYTCTKQDWISATNAFHSHIDGNVARFVNVLRNVTPRLYPSVDPPGFQQHGGAIGSGFRLTMSAASGYSVYYTTDGSDPRHANGSPAGTRYAGPLTLSTTTHVQARAYKSNNTWSALHAATYNYTAHYGAIRLTEIMYNPLGGADYEFIEITNTGSATRGLSRMRFTNGLRYTFPPGAQLAGGASLVLARNADAFAGRYPGTAVFGQYLGGLDNGGERITLSDGDGRTVASVRYNDKAPWPEAADGDGYSLVAAGTTGDPDDPAAWRASNLVGGSPGYDDGEPHRVVINEALTHTDLPQVDAVELYNAGSAAVDIGGWYLSDSEIEYRKFRIPNGTVIGAGAYAVFDEGDFNIDTNHPACFALSSHGDEVYLTAWDANTNLLYLAEARFGGAPNGVAFGRYVTTGGDTDFVAQRIAHTLGAANAPPLIGSVVISEVMYHPADGGDEYLELYNRSGDGVALYDPANPTHTWELSGAVSFPFPTSATIAAGAYVLVVPTDPGAFRSKYSIPGDVQIFGPYTGVLDNGGESVKLWRPDTPDPEGVPYILVDRVKYSDNSPWPESTDGGGPSLERQAADAYGNDPVNWTASLGAGGTPGARNSRVLLSERSGWRYHDLGADLGTAWRAASYDDSAWADGNAPLGYADPGGYTDLDTEIAWGENPAGKPLTTYFRKAFTLGVQPAGVTNLTLRARYDDGFVAWLNGQEVARAAMPGGPVAFSTPADSHAATAFETFDISAHAGNLAAGVNVLAVEVHQSGPTSSDLYLDVALTYEAAGQTGPSGVTTNVLDVRLASGDEDVEEWSNGFMDVTSSDLELTYDGAEKGDQTIGLRFAAVTVPPAATIQTAYVQFRAKDDGSQATALAITGQADDNAAPFGTAGHDLSSRPATVASTAWHPVAWTAGEAGEAERTPDLKAIVQEIVDRPGWHSGNALVIRIAGTGLRRAYSREGSMAGAAVLHVAYLTGAAPGDVDLDGMSDAWEQSRFGGTNAPNAGADQDYDGDGYSNYREYVAGTDPCAGGTTVFAVDVAAGTGGVVVSFTTVTAAGTGYEGMSRHYALEACSDPAGASGWNALPGYADILGTGQTVAYTNGGGGTAYYQGKVWLVGP